MLVLGLYFVVFDFKCLGDMYMMVSSESCASFSISLFVKGVYRLKLFSLYFLYLFINILFGFMLWCMILRVLCKYVNLLVMYFVAYIVVRGAKRIDSRNFTMFFNDLKCMSLSVIDILFLIVLYLNLKYCMSFL